MPNIVTTYSKKLIERALELYNYEVDGKRVYRVDAIPAILKREFPTETTDDRLSRGTIYFWLHRYDAVNYRVRREKAHAE